MDTIPTSRTAEAATARRLSLAHRSKAELLSMRDDALDMARRASATNAERNALRAIAVLCHERAGA
jgi:hypothetical protein